MPATRYLFCDLITDEDLCYLDVDGVTYGRRIVVPGKFKGQAPIVDSTTSDQARLIRGGRTICHIYEDADIQSSYIIWRAVPQQGEDGKEFLDLDGATLESAFYRRKLRANLTYTGQDQLAIACALISHMQTRPEGDLSIQLGALTSGVLRDRTYRASENAWYGTRLEQLAGVDGGFEYMIQVYVDPVSGQRVRLWVPGYPQLGNPNANWQFVQHGPVNAWAYPDDATEAATSWQTIGDTADSDLSVQGEPLLSDVFENSAMLADGWPLWDQNVTYSSVKIKATLNSYAAWLATNRSGTLRIPQATLLLSDDTSINPNRLGDAGTLTLNNQTYPMVDGSPSFNLPVRLTGIDVTPRSRSNPQKKATLIFAGQEV